MNDERLYPGGHRLARALEESVDELTEELQEGRTQLDTTYEVGDDIALAGSRLVERWYDNGSILASDMLALSKAIDLWDEWRKYGED